MKKKLIALTLMGISLTIAAKPLQEQIKKIQKAVALYAKNEVRSWKCLSELNDRLSHIERKMNKYGEDR